MIAILVDMGWHLIVLFFDISLIITEVGHVFFCLLIIWKKIYLDSLPIFKLGCLFVIDL